MPQPLVTTTTFDVILVLRESADGWRDRCIYKPHLFNAKSIDRLFRDFREVLEQMVMQPERPISAIRHRRRSASVEFRHECQVFTCQRRCKFRR